MEDPELRLLKYFAAVAEERHFGRAAERLHLAQPPLSQQIRKLEHQLGVELIDRSRRPIELTDAGDALYKEATLALAHGERAFAAARRAVRGHLGHLRIGALQAAGSCRRCCVSTEAHFPEWNWSCLSWGPTSRSNNCPHIDLMSASYVAQSTKRRCLSKSC